MSGICKHQSKLFIRLVCHSNNLSVAVRPGTSPSLNSEVDSNLQIGAGRSLTVTIGVEYPMRRNTVGNSGTSTDGDLVINVGKLHG